MESVPESKKDSIESDTLSNGGSHGIEFHVILTENIITMRVLDFR